MVDATSSFRVLLFGAILSSNWWSGSIASLTMVGSVVLVSTNAASKSWWIGLVYALVFYRPTKTSDVWCAKPTQWTSSKSSMEKRRLQRAKWTAASTKLKVSSSEFWSVRIVCLVPSRYVCNINTYQTLVRHLSCVVSQVCSAFATGRHQYPIGLVVSLDHFCGSIHTTCTLPVTVGNVWWHLL